MDYKELIERLKYYSTTYAIIRKRGDNMKIKGEQIFCWKCGNLLGVQTGEQVVSRHRGRIIEAHLPLTIICEQCKNRLTVSGGNGHNETDLR